MYEKTWRNAGTCWIAKLQTWDIYGYLVRNHLNNHGTVMTYATHQNGAGPACGHTEDPM